MLLVPANDGKSRGVYQQMIIESQILVREKTVHFDYQSVIIVICIAQRGYHSSTLR